MNVEDVIRIKIEEAARKIEAARRQRETRQEARRRGLAQRHAQKLRNLAAAGGNAEVAPDETPTLGTPDGQQDEECAPRARTRDGGPIFQAAGGTVPDDVPEVA